jgi:glycogen synthase kinase 3 alpha
MDPSLRSSYESGPTCADSRVLEARSKQQSRSFSYTAERVIGNGSFGVVYQAVAAESKETVAIKKVFQDRRYKNREFQIMKELGGHPNIVRLHHAFYTNGDKPDELFLNVVMEFVPETIHKLLKAYGKSRQQVPIVEAKLFIHQLCRGLAYLHASGVCHRDIKPQNLLICPRSRALKLCDFGSAKRLLPNEANVSYICSRYYRAPELIFGAVNYGFSLDNWSMGCVMAELLLGVPAFQGENGVDQLVQIIKILGAPSVDHLLAMNPNYTEFRFPQIKPISWQKLLSDRDIDGASGLLESILQYDPKARLSSAEILRHKWFNEIRKEQWLTISSSFDDAEKVDTSSLFDFTSLEMDYLNRQFLNAGVTNTVERDLVPEWFNEEAKPRTRSGSTSTGTD